MKGKSLYEEGERLANLTYVGPNPTGPQLGDLFGSVLGDHSPGNQYEVVVIYQKGQGARATYRFETSSDECVALESVTYSGGPGSPTIADGLKETGTFEMKGSPAAGPGNVISDDGPLVTAVEVNHTPEGVTTSYQFRDQK